MSLTRIAFSLLACLVSTAPFAAAATTLVANPSSLSFTYTPGQLPPSPQSTTVTTSTGDFPSISAVTTNQTWLVANKTGNVINVGVYPPSTFGKYTGAVTVSAAGASDLNIPVTVDVGNFPQTGLTVNPTLLSLTYNTGGALPPIQTVTVANAAGGAVAFTAQPSVGWLTVSPTSGTTPQNVSIQANPYGLPNGRNTGTVTFYGPAGTYGTLTVNLDVNGSTNNLILGPTSLVFKYQPGSTVPISPQLISVTDAAASSYTASAVTSTGGPWLLVNGGTSASSVISQPLQVTVNPGVLGVGSYTGTVTVQTFPDTLSQQVGVTLTVGTFPLQFSPGSLTFSVAAGSTTAISQATGLYTPGQSTSFQVLSPSATWITAVTPTSGFTTPQSISVTVNPTGITAGTYTATIPVQAAGTTENLPVTLVVGGTASGGGIVTPNPTSLSFTGLFPGGTAASLPLQLSSSVLPNSSFSISSNQPWLTVNTTGGFLPATVTVTANPATLTAGTFGAQLAIVANSQTTIVPVSVTVSQASAVVPFIVSVTPNTGTATSQLFSILLTDPSGTSSIKRVDMLLNDQLTGSATSGCNISYNNGNVSLLSNSGTSYLGPVPIGSGTSLSNSQCTLNAALSSATITAGGLQLNLSVAFAAGFNGKKTIWVNAYDAAGGSTGWLAYGAYYPGAAPGTLASWHRLIDPFSHSHFYTTDTAEVAGLVGRGFTDEGAVARTQNAPAGLGTPLYRLAVKGSTMHFWTADFNEYRTLIQNTAFWVGEGIDGFVWTALGQAPNLAPVFRLAFKADPLIHLWTLDANERDTLQAGGGWVYEGIAFYVTSLPAAPAPRPRMVSRLRETGPQVLAVMNAASYQGGSLAPGEAVRIYGTGFGEGARVTIGGVPAEITSVSEREIDAVVPAGVEGQSTASVVVEYLGAQSEPVDHAVTFAYPAIFAEDLFGHGQAQALNEDGAANGTDAPAAVGSVIAVNVTGLSGALPVSARIGGFEAMIIGREEVRPGVTALRIQVPEGVAGFGVQPLTIQSGEAYGQLGVSVVVK